MIDKDNIDTNLPLIDLHRHLAGNIRLETVLDLANQYGLPLPGHDMESLRPYAQAMVPQPGLMAFIDKISLLASVLVDLDACHRVAYENVVDAAREGIDYLELRFSPGYMAEAHQLDSTAVTEAVIDGIHAGKRETGLQVNLIGIMSRTYGAQACWNEFAALKAYHQHITALDLAGDEVGYPAELFDAHFREARNLGWHITVHAGEAAGPASIWRAIEHLGAERIGHGIQSIEDPDLMDYLAENRIGLEINLTSNVQISAVPNYASHPLKQFLDHGMLCNINTDDPSVSGIDLRHEYRVAAPAAGLTPEDIRQVQLNALEMAFLNEDEKEILRQRKLQ